VKVENLEEENSSIRNNLDYLEAQLHDANEALQDLMIKLEKSKTEVADVLFEKNRLFKENQKLDQNVQEKKTENKTMKSEAKDIKTVIENLKSDAKIANKTIQSSKKEITRLEHKNSNLEESINNKKVENKKLKDEKKKHASENLKLETKCLTTKQQEKKARATTHDKATITMSTTPLITNPPTLCIKETQTGIDRNLNLIPPDQLNTSSMSTTSSQSLLSPSPLHSLLSTTPTTNMKSSSSQASIPGMIFPFINPMCKVAAGVSTPCSAL
jgi:chromosome segregation ATPase